MEDLLKKIKCPICKKNTSLNKNQYRPFCSERCKVQDLGAWADEKYSMPSENNEGSGEEQEDENLSEKTTYH